MTEERPSVVIEAVVVGAAVLVGLCAVSLWVGVLIAALVFGSHDAIRVSFRDALNALSHVASHWGDPKLLWPRAVRSAVPDAWAVWGCTVPVLVLLGAVAGVALWLMRRRRVGPERRRRMGLDPEARFARVWDVAPLWVRNPVQGRVVLGRVGRHLVATEDRLVGLDGCVPRWLRARADRRTGDRGAIVVVGPSRCGKTTALAIPAILEWAGPVIALSVKADLLDATVMSRRKRGAVQVFDPTDATGVGDASWSPLRDAKTLPGARKAAQALSNATDWATGAGDMRFWVANAEDLLAPLLWLAAVTGVGMAEVVAWIVAMDTDSENGPVASQLEIAKVLAPDRLDVERARLLLEGTWAYDIKQVSSIYVTAKTMIAPWLDPTVAQSARDCSIDLDWLLGASNTLYLCSPLYDAARLAPVLAGLLSDLFEQAYAKAAATNRAIGPVLVVIDEAGNWPLRDLPALASTCAGVGMQLMVIFQSKAQIDAAYGVRADTVLSNCITKVFFAGISDAATLQYAASLLGAEHVVTRQTTVDVSMGRQSVSESATRTELMPMSLLRQVRDGEALLIHNTLPPAHLIGRYWFEQRQWRDLPTLHGDPVKEAIVS
jgi:type IV secretion system protein VirD4